MMPNAPPHAAAGRYRPAGKSAGLLSVMSADMTEVRELTTEHWKDQEKAKSMLTTLATAAASFQVTFLEPMVAEFDSLLTSNHTKPNTLTKRFDSLALGVTSTPTLEPHPSP